jgi:hypothetical protein
MTVLATVSAEWLTLRGEADARARSRTLVDELAHRLGDGPLIVHDLGSGAGAMMRWLAPQLRAPQRWVLHDADPQILGTRDPSPVLDGQGQVVGSQPSIEQLDDLGRDAFHGGSAVVASALLDVITENEARLIVNACVSAGTPALFSLSVSGQVLLDPGYQADEHFGAAFNDHQRRVADGRRLLGPDAVRVVARMFATAGWSVRELDTPWRLGPDESTLSAEWLAGWVGAAVEQRPELDSAADRYLALRRTQLAARSLSVTVGHRDVIAWPQ